MNTLLFLLVLTPAQAEARDVEASVEQSLPVEHTWFNLRLGASPMLPGTLPTMCGEVSPLRDWSIEACGNGSGFLHGLSSNDMAHFRGKYRVFSFAPDKGTRMSANFGLGFAELEVAAGDTSGFNFVVPEGQTVPSAAGPEAAIGFQLQQSLGFGFEGLLNLTFGSAWLPASAQLVVPQAQLQPFASFELGLGW